MIQIHLNFVPNIFFTKLVKYFGIYLQKTWRAGQVILKFGVLSNEVVLRKTRKQKIYLGSPSWCKYFPNIFFIIFIRKYFLKYLVLCLGFFNAPFNSSPNFPLLALFSNCNWGWLWQIVLKYLLKVKLNPNILTNILSEIMRLLENVVSGKKLVQISNWHLYMGIAA